MTINIDVTDPFVDQTTNATPKTLATISLDNHAIERVHVSLTAFCTDDDFKTWEFSGVAKRPTSGNVILYGDLLNILPDLSSGLSVIGWGFDAVVSGGDVNFVFTGQSGKTIDLLLIIELGAKFTP